MSSNMVFAEEIIVHKDWSQHFKKSHVEGTIVLWDERKKEPKYEVYSPERAQIRFSPASTFKIPHTLFALDKGLIKGDKEIIKWDGKVRSYEPWNKDQTLGSAIANSTVWVFERFADHIGRKSEQNYIVSCNYGNMDSSGKDPFWIKGNLRISAYEQVIFLRRLYDKKLPFQQDHLSLVQKLIQSDDKNLSIHAKSGWDGSIGWWVGWCNTPQGAIFFALNIDTPNGIADLPARTQVTKAVLQSVIDSE